MKNKKEKSNWEGPRSCVTVQVNNHPWHLERQDLAAHTPWQPAEAHSQVISAHCSDRLSRFSAAVASLQHHLWTTRAALATNARHRPAKIKRKRHSGTVKTQNQGFYFTKN
jgi:hypothetical protein